MYPNYPYFAVAITRTCGSGGGSYIGKKLAQDFDIDLYDRKLLRLAAEDSGINEKIFAAADENTKKTLLYRVSRHIYDGSVIPPESGNFISDQNLFNYQAKVLRELAGIETHIAMIVGDARVAAASDDDAERTTPDGKTSSVHFLRFPFARAAIEAFKADGARVMLAVEHPNYTHLTVLSDETRRALAADFG